MNSPLRFLWLALCASVIVFGFASSGQATTVALGLTVDTTSSTWTVTAISSNALQLGIVSWAIDVNGSGGISILPAANASQTNQTPASVFSQLRTTGTVSGTNLIDIHASQDQIDEVNVHNDSGAAGGTALVYGYGFSGTANGQFTSNNYGHAGPVTGLGPITLATGLYTGPVFPGTPTITAQLHPGDFFNFFPLNFDPDDNPPVQGGVENAVAATNVTSVVFSFSPVPEPASVLLLGLGGCVCLAFAGRRRVQATR